MLMKLFKKIVKDDEDRQLRNREEEDLTLTEEDLDLLAQEDYQDISEEENYNEYVEYKNNLNIVLDLFNNDTAIEIVPEQRDPFHNDDYKIDVFSLVFTENFPCNNKDQLKPSIYTEEEEAVKIKEIFVNTMLPLLNDVNNELNNSDEKQALIYYRRNRKRINLEYWFEHVMTKIRREDSYYQTLKDKYLDLLHNYKDEVDKLRGEELKKEKEQIEENVKQKELQWQKEKQEKQAQEFENIRQEQKEMYEYPELNIDDENVAKIDYERGHSEEDKVVYYWPMFLIKPFNKPRFSFDHIYTSEQEAEEALKWFKKSYEWTITQYKDHIPHLQLEQILDETKKIFDQLSSNINAKKKKKMNANLNIVNAYDVMVKYQFENYSLQQLDSIAYKFNCHISDLKLEDPVEYDVSLKEGEEGLSRNRENTKRVKGTMVVTGLEENIKNFLDAICVTARPIPYSKETRETTKGDLRYKEAAYSYPTSNESTLYTLEIDRLEKDPQALIYALSDYIPSNMYAARMIKTDAETFVPTFLRSPFVNAFKALDKDVQKNLWFNNEENAWAILEEFLKYCLNDNTLKDMLVDLEDLTTPVKKTEAGNEKQKTQKELDKQAKSTKVKKAKEAAKKIIPEKAKEFFNLDTTKKKIEDDHNVNGDIYKVDEPKFSITSGTSTGYLLNLPKIKDGVKEYGNVSPQRYYIMITPNGKVKKITKENVEKKYIKTLLIFIPDAKIYPILCNLYKENPDNFNWNTLYGEYKAKYDAWFKGVVFNEIKNDLMNFRQRYGIVKWNEISTAYEADQILEQYKRESNVFKQFQKLCSGVVIDDNGKEVYEDVEYTNVYNEVKTKKVPKINEDVKLDNDTVVNYYDSIDFTFTNQENEDFSYDKDTIQNLADKFNLKLISYEEVNPYELEEEKAKEYEEKDYGLTVYYQVKGRGKNILDFIWTLYDMNKKNVKYPVDPPIVTTEKGEKIEYSPYIIDKELLEKAIKENLKNYLELGYLSYKDRLYKYS